MWCAHCRCEVPVEVSADAGEIRCAVCQELMPGGLDAASILAAAVADGSDSTAGQTAMRAGPESPSYERTAPPPSFEEDWQLQHDLQQAKFLLQREADDADHDLSRDVFATAAATMAAVPQVLTTERPTTPSFARRLCGAVLWLVFCLGTMALTFGAGLLGCTIAWQRNELWNWGLLTVLAGQFVVLLSVAGLFALRARSRQAPPRALRSHHRFEPAPCPEPPRLPWSQRSSTILSLPLDTLRQA